MDSNLDKLAPALVALQGDLSPVSKSAENPFFKSSYAPLPEVMKAVQPLLAKHKLAVTQFPSTVDGQSALRTILIHESGQLIEDTQLLLLTKQDPQGQGSAITYARRYGVMAVLGLVADEDDDGAAGNTPPAPRSGNTYEASTNRVPSEKQLNFIHNLAVQKGKDDEWIKKTMAAVKTSSDASLVIDKLNELEDA